MDINDLRSGVTLLGFLLFLALVVRVWRRAAMPAHTAAAELVFQGEIEATPQAGAVDDKEINHG